MSELSTPADEERLSAREHDAYQCAEISRKYWHDLGHTDAMFWVKAVTEKEGSFIVCSNLIDGFPPSARKAGRRPRMVPKATE